MVDAIGCGTIIFALVGALFAFISYGTMGWTIQNYIIEGSGGVIISDYKLFQGLLQFRRQITVTNDSTGVVSYSENTLDTTCENLALSSTQCDYLENAQNAAATAVACKFLLNLL
jgi:hypothetical protein